jgi:hypothetical protein
VAHPGDVEGAALEDIIDPERRRDSGNASVVARTE